MSWLTVHDDAVVVDVVVVPRASRNRIVGVQGERLKVQVHAPPVEGEANAAVVAVIAKALGVNKRAVQIVSGQTGRRKRIRIDGVDEDDVRARVPSPHAPR